MAIIESIPNVSEGRRLDVVERFAAAIRRTPGFRLLDSSSDASRNRTVFTLAGDTPAVKAATLALFEQAIPAIELRQHRGEHPRLGAAVAKRFQVPVYFYEEAAGSPLSRNLEDIRRGEFEGPAAKVGSPDWRPDFGPATPHQSAAPQSSARACRSSRTTSI